MVAPLEGLLMSFYNRDSVFDRLMARTEIVPYECWLWKGAISSGNKYGMIGDGPTKVLTTHRAAYMLAFGDVPDGLWVLHKCNNRQCVNPNHLYAGTPLQNVNDMWNAGAARSEIRKYVTPEVERKRVRSLPRGERHHRSMAKITAEQAREIFLSPLSQAKLGKQYGICQQAVCDIKNLVTWRHVNANT